MKPFLEDKSHSAPLRLCERQATSCELISCVDLSPFLRTTKIDVDRIYAIALVVAEDLNQAGCSRHDRWVVAAYLNDEWPVLLATLKLLCQVTGRRQGFEAPEKIGRSARYSLFFFHDPLAEEHLAVRQRGAPSPGENP